MSHSAPHSGALSITNLTHQKTPDIPYSKIKAALLPKSYSLSVAYVGATRAQKLNKTLRKKTYTPNILTFPLDDSHGEIVICLTIAQKEAKKLGITVEERVTLLLIHGILHIVGEVHGPQMEEDEARLTKKFLANSNKE